MILRASTSLIPRRSFCTTVPSSSSSFDVDLVNRDYASKSERAARNRHGNDRLFKMVLPPPNVTGKLHLGHALTVTVEDAIARHHRLRGGSAVWLPGFDHAGIATQSVVERELWREKKKTRHEMSREEFVDYCSQWSKSNSTIIKEQLQRLGATLDWDNCYYTLDEKFSAAVTRAFCELHSDGLIYRDKRMVHWCPQLRSSLSDQEVERIDILPSSTISIPSPNGGKRSVPVGVMYTVRYMDEQGKGYLEVGTTRPETLFGDVALAVHPTDDRYSSWVGRRVRHPVENRWIVVVGDEKVQKDKGTGVVKITPSHDYLDAEIASRHWREIIDCDGNARNRVCLDDSGRMINSAPEYNGMDRFEAREKIISQLILEGLGGKRMEHSGGQINICSRTGDVIEPRLTEQWFMKCEGMHEEAMKALKDGRIVLSPSYQEQKLMDWFSYSEPWCLSRQLLWGHRIPAYRVGEEGNWTISPSQQDALRQLGCTHTELTQDVDVLDTWFSSSLVPLVTCGWMDGRLDVSRPLLSIMETGNDILGFWVARMIMMTMRLSGGQVPFHRVLLHGLVRDGNGRKMSKSLGNVIDPLDVLDGISVEGMIERMKKSNLGEREIASASADLLQRYPSGLPRAGSDGLRFALLRHDITAADVPLNVAVLAEEGLRFCNKLWNLVNYMETVEKQAGNVGEFNEENVKNTADLWLLSRLHSTLSLCDSHMQSDCPHLAFQTIHKFILANLCDTYLETTKPALWNDDKERIGEVAGVLQYTVSTVLTQLSAFMPHVSEHLYEKIGGGRDRGDIYDNIVKSNPSLISSSLDSQMDLCLSIVSSVRSIKAQLQLAQKLPFEGILQVANGTDISPLSDILLSLCNLRLSHSNDLSPSIENGFMPCAVSGYDAKLFIRIESSHRLEFIDRLRRQFDKYVERANQFEEKASKYDDIVKRDTENEGKVKQSVIDKNTRKARQARQVSESAIREAERLREIIDQAERADGQTKEESAV